MQIQGPATSHVVMKIGLGSMHMACNDRSQLLVLLYLGWTTELSG